MIYGFVALSAMLSALSTEALAAGPLDFNMTAVKRGATLTPVMNGQNFPDPSVIRTGDSEWWAFATNAKVNGKLVHVQMAHTTDFKTWTHLGQQDALPTLPAWIDPSSPKLWAPDVVELANGRFIMYYTAAYKTNPALHCLGVAYSDKGVSGPYSPMGSYPWACPTSQGGAIDPAGYYDPKDNTRWVVYKIDGNAIGHGGICNNGKAPVVKTPIVIQQVSTEDGYTKIGEPSSPLIVNDAADGPVVEAPSLTKMSDGTYVLFFSSNCFATPLYDVSYATSKNIKGPYTKHGPMFVTGTDGLTAPGGLDICINGDHTVFHANWKGGRAMFTALIRGTNPDYRAYVKTS